MTKHVTINPSGNLGKPKTDLDRVEGAIQATARAMTLHPDLAAQIRPKLKELQTERDRLLEEGDPVEYARSLLRR
jgi:hypothetical protein